ncbi:sugar transferase [Adlercreutzia sp. ZJ242]|uniref:sugar transferase n=1 Tax=Adlercreutzia sp. ZJ242 TaxID=2709409 RepID=UPI0013EB9677|nr:sugar transferase [Adlercreutzia sp. ZJ242]
MYERYVKRVLDVAVVLAALLLFWWVYAVLAVLVRVKLGSPVIFAQDRPGKDERVFKLYKFRTMTDARGEDGEPLPDEERLTPFGRALRSTSLDELPELVNILKGDMSLVGPRPLLVEYLPLYSEEQRHRHDVRPGLTGWAQVNGRNAIRWEDKFRYDLEYADNCTLAMDMRVFVATFKVLLRRSGISSETSATMERFAGAPGELEGTAK